MKLRSFALIVTLISSSLFAQTRLLVMQDVVYPNKAEQYEKAQKEMNQWLIKNIPGIKWTCLQRDNFTYTYLVEMQSYSKMDEMNKMWDERMKASDQSEFNKYADAFLGTISHTNQYSVRKLDKASYLSENPYTKQDDNVFIHWDYYEVIPGSESSFTKLLEDEAAISQKTKMGLSYNCWKMEFGDNNSSYIFATWGKNSSEFFGDIQKDNKLGGQEMVDLDKKVMSYVQKFDHWNGKLRKDLSIEAVALNTEQK